MYINLILLNCCIFLFFVVKIACCQTQPDVSPDIIKSVDVFWGTGSTDLGEYQSSDNFASIEKRWQWLKQKSGNTHPGATLPFGLVSVNAFGNGYPTGYNGEDFFGMSHFHQSGTGTIRWYYNYFLITPTSGNLDLSLKKQSIKTEDGRPGYYSCTLDNTNTTIKSSVTRKAAMHVFQFEDTDTNNVIINFKHFYTPDKVAPLSPEVEKFPEDYFLNIISDKTASGCITMDGVPIFFYLEIDSSPNLSGSFDNDHIYENNSNLQLKKHIKRGGIYYTFYDLHEICLKIGFSFKDEDQAKENLIEDLPSWDFSEVKKGASLEWAKYLGKIKINDTNENKVNLFYSALYKAIIKPSSFPGENPLWDSELYYVDFATLWDMYQTQLPLVFTFFPNRGKEIVAFYSDLYRQFKTYPICYIMSKEYPKLFEKQASGLGNIMMADAFFKGIENDDWKAILYNMSSEIFDTDKGRQFINGVGLTPSISHNVDLSYASYLTALMANDLNDPVLFKKMFHLSELWHPFYNPATGLLWDGRFYEGDNINHSFKLYHNIEGIAKLVGSDESLVRILDGFFGFRDDYDGMTFEGLNNQVDMTSPYSYFFLSRPDRIQEITRTIIQSRFHNGRYGLPGNDDSGGLSSWFVWNCIGLFPIAGQDKYIINTPQFNEITLHLRNDLVIRKVNNRPEFIYIDKVFLNNIELDRLYLTNEEINSGGELRIEMKESPSKNKFKTYKVNCN